MKASQERKMEIRIPGFRGQELHYLIRSKILTTNLPLKNAESKTGSGLFKNKDNRALP
jgi:hypothetical protein